MMILKCRAGYGIFSEEMDLSHWKDWENIQRSIL